MIGENSLPEGWKEVELREILDYEQPNNYIIEGKILKNKTSDSVPVLTANKSFILGYTNEKEGVFNKLPAVIFDDFTTDKKFVEFEFKVKSSAMKILKPKSKNIDLKFVFCMMKGINIDSTTHKRYYLSLYQKKKIPLPFTSEGIPDLKTQQKIIAIIKKAEQLKELRNESDKLTDDYLNSVFLDMFGHPVKNEKKWGTMPLQKISTMSRGKSQHRPRNAPFLFGGKYPFIQTGDISNSNGKITSYSQTLSEAGIKQSKLFPKGTIVMSIAANIGYTAILDFNSYFPDSIVGIISNDDYILPTYLHHCLKFHQKKLEKEASSTAQKNINLRILNPLEVPVPPIELQNKFTRIIKNIEKLKERQKEAQQQIDDLFNCLMQKAFRGELNC